MDGREKGWSLYDKYQNLIGWPYIIFMPKVRNANNRNIKMYDLVLK